MNNINCKDCAKRAQGGCEKHPQKICSIKGCDKKCGYSVHGTIKRKPVTIPRLNYIFNPKFQEDGLVIILKSDEGAKVLKSNIIKGQRTYQLPDDFGTIEGVYIKIR